MTGALLPARPKVDGVGDQRIMVAGEHVDRDPGVREHCHDMDEPISKRKAPKSQGH